MVWWCGESSLGDCDDGGGGGEVVIVVSAVDSDIVVAVVVAVGVVASKAQRVATSGSYPAGSYTTSEAITTSQSNAQGLGLEPECDCMKGESVKRVRSQ